MSGTICHLCLGPLTGANLTGLDWTQKYLAIVEAAESLPATQAAYLDGELCGMRSDGTTSFSMIQAASDAG